jgi:hypothetical protein
MKWSIGWAAVILSTLLASFWGFWGAIENFHEGWYSADFLSNLGLMFAQYLSPMLLFILSAVAAIRWPRVGGGTIVLAGLVLPMFLIRTSAAIYLIGLPLVLLGMMYWYGQPVPRVWAYRIIILAPLVVALGCAIGPAIRVAGRMDDGQYGMRELRGNGVDLLWAPEGPGWPNDTRGYSWNEAVWICRHLNAGGNALSEVPLDLWRLPTVDEIARTAMIHGVNAGGRWDSLSSNTTFDRQPDKESPLWKIHSPIIYWWTSTCSDSLHAYRYVYNGMANPLPRNIKMGDLAFRAVRPLPGKR